MSRKRLTRSQQVRYQGRPSEAESSEACRGLRVVRYLDPEQALAIRSALREIDDTPANTIIRGDGGSNEPDFTVIAWHESEAWNFLREHDADDVKQKIYDGVPTLREPLHARIQNIGKFGMGNTGFHIAASFDTSNAPDRYVDRGSIQTVLCELNDWGPVPMHERANPHSSLANLPPTTPLDVIQEYKNAVAAILTPGVELHFSHAFVQTS